MNQNYERGYRKAEKEVSKIRTKEKVHQKLDLVLKELDSILEDVESIRIKDFERIMSII